MFYVRREDLRRVALWRVSLFWLGTLVYFVSITTLVRSFIVRAFKIPSGSMEPSLLIRDHVLVDEAPFGKIPAARGQIIVFRDAQRPNRDFVERVIGLPGDRIEVRAGYPWINGWPVPHCTVSDRVTLPSSRSNGGTSEVEQGELSLEYLSNEAYWLFISARPDIPQGPWSVKPNELFVLGDNRMNCFDSRAWFQGRGGGVPRSNLVGHPLFIWLSFMPDGGTDWSRAGQSVDGPHLPTSVQHLESSLRDCLRRRPSQTEPPAPT